VKPDRDDPILDAFLAEVLGGQSPPDLSARILQSREAAPPPISVERTWLEPVAPPVAEPPRVQATLAATMSTSAALRLRRPRRRTTYLPLVTSGLAALLAVASLVGYVVYQRSLGDLPVAVTERDKTPKPPAPRSPSANHDAENQIATDTQNHTGPVFEQPKPVEVVYADPPTAWKDLAPAPDSAVVSLINQSIRQSWEAAKVEPAPPATDTEFCNRAFERILGRAPGAAELDAYANDPSASKRESLVDKLLTDNRYTAEFARFWAGQMRQKLVGRQDQPGAKELQQHLEKAILADTPYDKLAAGLISAVGSTKPGAPDYNGAAGFLLASESPKATLATARTARAFLGKQLACAQCHDRPAENLAQKQYWALNSFFRQLHVERQRGSSQARLVNRDFAGEQKEKNKSHDAAVFYDDRTGKMNVAYPEFLDGTAIGHSGKIADVDRRKELARLVTKSDDFTRAAVNQLWAHFFGYGLTRPIDDMGPHHPPSHPEALETLASQFKAHGYKTKSLVRWLALSEPFGLSAKGQPTNLTDSPQLGSVALYSRYYERPASGRPAYDALVAAADIARRGGTAIEKEAARLAWLGQAAPPDKTANQNLQIVQPVLSTEQSVLLSKITDSKMKPAEKIEHVFQIAVGRSPTQRESGIVDRILRAHKGSASDALPDIWWALMSSSEFRLAH
jgi:hypothetical protein